MAILAAVVAVAAIAAGCGGGSDASTAALSKAEFTKQANAICEKGRLKIEKELGAFVRKIGGPTQTPTKAQVAEMAGDIIVPQVKWEAERLREVGLPSGDEAEMTAMLEAFDRGVEEGEADPSAVFGGNGYSNSLGKAVKTGTDYGLRGCGQI
jgi:hypothetical protein